MAKPKAKAKPKRKTSFGQFDQGRGSQAARQKTRALTSDARTITGGKLTRRQRENIDRQNRRKS